MISNIAGTILKKNTKTKIWWIKLALALIVSNIFFFVLFAGATEAEGIVTSVPPEGSVEMQLKAELLTPFQQGKKVLLIQRAAGRKVEAILKAEANLEGRITVLVQEADAQLLLRYEFWEILPYLKNLILSQESKGTQHEIRY